MLIIKIENRINDINIYYKSYNYGYAFIEFDSVKIAKRVIQQYNGRVILGQYLNLNFGRENSNYTKKCNKIYTVSNLFIFNLNFSFLFQILTKMWITENYINFSRTNMNR